MDFLDGDGTAENPYQISTTTHLNNVRKYPDAHFQLVKDLEFIEADFSEGGEFYNNGQGWEPIGTKETPFTGVFNGCGYTIQGLFIHRALGETTYTGLFGYTTGTIRDVALLDSNLTGGSSWCYIGGIAGYNTGCILRCSFEGILSGDGGNAYAGGIAGCNEGVIRACHSGGKIFVDSSSGTSDAYGGGIVGINERTVSACYNTASLKTILNTVGGIAGWNRHDATVNNCYNTGSVYAQTSSVGANAGGIVGKSQSIISRCYNVGDVSRDPYTYAPHAGGIVGESIYGRENDCYYLDTISTGGVSGSTIVKCTEEQLRQQSTFVGFDFDTIWTWDESGAYAYPVLREIPKENTAEFLGGDGTAANPYLISDLTHLDNVRHYPDAHFHLIADLTFTEEDFAKDGLFYNDGRGWEPIGTDVYTAFTGTLDGDGHTITGLQIQMTVDTYSKVYAGLFGQNRGLIQNLHMQESSVSVSSHSDIYVGGIAGYSFGKGSLIGCTNSGSVAAYTDNKNFFDISTSAGGIVGYNDGGIITDCSNTGSVLSSHRAGGIVGHNTSVIDYPAGGAVTDCSNTGSVSSAYHAGGIAGNNDDGTINGCRNTGSVSGSSDSHPTYAGGIAGSSNDAMAGSIKDAIITGCYNGGEVGASYAGGIVGINYSPLTLCVNTSKVAGSTVAGGIAGENYNNCVISRCYNSGTVAQDGSNSSASSAGGIAGNVYSAAITNCYNIGAVTANSSRTYAGGIAGRIYNGEITNCYNTGTITSILYAYGIAGVAYDGVITDCYYLNNISCGISSGPGATVSCTAEEMMKQNTFEGFDFDAIWSMEGNADYLYPELQGVEMIFTKSLAEIKVTKQPDKLSYLEGAEFDPTGMEVTACYNNGTSETVSEYEINGYTSTPGTKTITVSFGGKSTTFQVTVTAKSLLGIQVMQLPEKLSYLEGKDTLDVTGGKLTLTYNNGTTEVIDLTTEMVSGFDNTQVGKQTLTVNYQDRTTTFEVEIIAKSLTEIKVTKQPDKLTYLEGDNFDPTGLEVTATYNNGTSEKISDYDISGYTSTPGTKTITITYDGKTATFEVTVESKSLTEIKVTKKPYKLTYLVGDDFDPTGLEVTATYNNGMSEVVEDYQFSGYDPTLGTKTITITYGEETTTFEVTVNDKTLVSIAVTKNPDKMTYIEGTDLDTKGMELTLTYDNGTKEVVTTGWTETYDFSRPGQREVQIAYQGKKTTLTVTVVAKSLTGIAVTQKPDKLTYLEGEMFDTAGMVVTASYNNGTSGAVTGYTWSGYNPSRVGTQTITVTYGGKTATFTVTVKSRVPGKITSGTYSIGGGYISKIKAGTTVSQLLNGINEKAYCRVYKGNTEVTGSAVIGTGMEIRLLDGNTVKDRVTVVVTGDTNGDGNITITDMLAVKSHLLKKSTLSGAAAKAADTSGDKAISITDFIQIKAHILSKDKIQPRAC